MSASTPACAATPYFLTAEDGHHIPVLEWQPPDPPRAVVQIAHGMGEHAGRYDRLARALTAQGYAVYANQHRGHGPQALEAATRGNFGPGGFASVVADMHTLTRHMRHRHAAAPLVLLGHSMGSFAAQAYALAHSGWLHALVLSGTAATDLLQEGRRAQKAGLSELGNADAQPRTPFDWLSRDEAEVDKYIADPLCGFMVTPESMASIFTTCAATASPGGFSCVRPTLPIYLVTGSRDPVNADLAWFHPLVERMRAAGLAQVATRIYDGARHEVFNESNRSEVTSELCAWLDKACRS